MKIRQMSAAMVPLVTLAALVSTPCLLAAPLFHHTAEAPVRAAHVHRINFDLRNSSATSLVINTGDASVTLQPGQTTTLKLPAGTTLTSASTAPHYTPGELISVVTASLDGNVLVLN